MSVKSVGSVVVGMVIGISGGAVVLADTIRKYERKLASERRKSSEMENAYLDTVKEKLELETKLEELDPNSDTNQWKRLIKRAQKEVEYCKKLARDIGVPEEEILKNEEDLRKFLEE